MSQQPAECRVRKLCCQSRKLAADPQRHRPGRWSTASCIQIVHSSRTMLRAGSVQDARTRLCHLASMVRATDQVMGGGYTALADVAFLYGSTQHWFLFSGAYLVRVCGVLGGLCVASAALKASACSCVQPALHVWCQQAASWCPGGSPACKLQCCSLCCIPGAAEAWLVPAGLCVASCAAQ